MHWFIYIVKCHDETFYTGITTDISRRVREHNAKRGGSYTKHKTPVELVHQEALLNRSLALKREAAIKKLTRKEKIELIKGSLLSTC
jgi:putative endonuclease